MSPQLAALVTYGRALEFGYLHNAVRELQRSVRSVCWAVGKARDMIDRALSGVGREDDLYAELVFWINTANGVMREYSHELGKATDGYAVVVYGRDGDPVHSPLIDLRRELAHPAHLLRRARESDWLAGVEDPETVELPRADDESEVGAEDELLALPPPSPEPAPATPAPATPAPATPAPKPALPTASPGAPVKTPSATQLKLYASPASHPDRLEWPLTREQVKEGWKVRTSNRFPDRQHVTAPDGRHCIGSVPQRPPGPGAGSLSYYMKQPGRGGQLSVSFWF